ncbi:MAG: EAL domain-containing protein [Hyphomicrobiales bacterium]|nr:EAL domain-containing protein [Hyphomicrobiales bacterium]
MTSTAFKAKPKTSTERLSPRADASALIGPGLIGSSLEALLALTHADHAFPAIFAAIREIVECDQVLALEDVGTSLQCIAAQPEEPAGLHLAISPFLKQAMTSRGPSIGGELEVIDGAYSCLSAIQCALALPLRTRNFRGVLVLVRVENKEPFSEAEIASARQFAPLCSAALALQDIDQVKAEAEQLRDLVDNMRRNEARAAQNLNVLWAVLDALPISLTLQDNDGRVILTNRAAGDVAAREQPDAAIHADRPEIEPGSWSASDESAPGEFLTEEHVDGAGGKRTLLTYRGVIQIDDQPLQLSTAVDITARKEIERQLTLLAYLDDLTGLPKQTFIKDHINEIIGQRGASTRFALAFIDLDNFKHINDYYSHSVGDALLAQTAQRMLAVTRSTDMVARISGDEFVVVIDPVESAAQLREHVDRILGELKQPFYIEGFEVFSSASIGVSLYPDHGSNYEHLRRHADSAMYQAKIGSKGSIAFFDDEMGRTLSARMEMEQRLRLAIRDERFCCAYQPKVDIRNQEIVGFEALIRYRDDKGLVTGPGAFVELATEIGLMDAMTHFVLRESAKALQELDRTFRPNTTMSINIAAKLANNLTFMESLIEALVETGRAERFILELTEDALVTRNDFQTCVLPQLRKQGIRVSIDDFGTGYSSLSGLADITVDEVKIDRSFISGIQHRQRSQSVLRAVESICHAFGMTIVAEGIETFEELAFLQAATRIRYGQGYYFARPFFLEDFAGSRGRLLEDRMSGTIRRQEQGREASQSRQRDRNR